MPLLILPYHHHIITKAPGKRINESLKDPSPRDHISSVVTVAKKITSKECCQSYKVLPALCWCVLKRESVNLVRGH